MQKKKLTRVFRPKKKSEKKIYQKSCNTEIKQYRSNKRWLIKKKRKIIFVDYSTQL